MLGFTQCRGVRLLAYLEVTEDISLLPSCSHNYLSAVSIACDSTIPGSYILLKSSAIAVKPVSNLHTREPENKATISTATHFSALSTAHCMAFISVKYMMIAMPSEIEHSALCGSPWLTIAVQRYLSSSRG